MFNAASSLGLSARDLCAGFDSVSACLSKVLGAPAGSVLAGGADLIGRARRARKILGGGMRQAGILAAAGLYALDHNIERLAEDHQNALRLAAALETIAELGLDPVQTNMVFVRVPQERCAALADHLRSNGIVALVSPRTRLCTHLDVDAAGIDHAAAAFHSFFAG